MIPSSSAPQMIVDHVSRWIGVMQHKDLDALVSAGRNQSLARIDRTALVEHDAHIEPLGDSVRVKELLEALFFDNQNLVILIVGNDVLATSSVPSGTRFPVCGSMNLLRGLLDSPSISPNSCSYCFRMPLNVC